MHSSARWVSTTILKRHTDGTRGVRVGVGVVEFARDKKKGKKKKGKKKKRPDNRTGSHQDKQKVRKRRNKKMKIKRKHMQFVSSISKWKASCQTTNLTSFFLFVLLFFLLPENNVLPSSSSPLSRSIISYNSLWAGQGRGRWSTNVLIAFTLSENSINTH